MSDLIYIFQWWLMLFIIGVVFLPFTSFIFSRFFDRGYIFSKTLGISLLSYTIYLLGTIHALPFNRLTSITIFFFYLVAFIFLKKIKNFYKVFWLSIKEKWKILILEELIFIASFLFWTFIRSHQPDIHGIEKFMDYGFVNTILRSEYFPPKDMWYAPFSINYYYFGHLVTAILTKISGISSYISYNLMIATLFALIFSSSFSIGINFIYHSKYSSKIRYIAGGFLAAFLVTLSGNLQDVYSFFVPYQGDNPVPFWNLTFSPQTFPNSYWYPSATRFIYHTIHEFPAYALTLSDLHGHLLDTPFTLLTIALLFIMLIKLSSKELVVTRLKSGINFIYVILLCILLAIMYMTNAWDGIIYLLLILILSVFIFLKPLIKTDLKKQSFYSFLSVLLFIGILFFILSLPFNLFYKPFVSGIGIICPPKFLVGIGQIGPFVFDSVCQRSYLWELLILYGFFYFWIIPFLYWIYKKWRLNKPEISTTEVFILVLILTGTILIFVPETIYLRDIFTTYPRANTMFKIAYQIFIILSLCISYIIIFALSKFKDSIKKRYKKTIIYICYFLFASVLVFLVSIYPFFAINSFYNNLSHYYGLNGLKYLDNLYPTDYQAISWINKNIKGQPVILEAQGDSYTDFARVSVNTGLPTVLGWTVHEWFWRGTYDLILPRINDVATLYGSSDLKLTKALLEKYNVSYVFIGTLERQRYPTLNPNKFEKLGKVVFRSGNTLIIKINT